MDKRYKSLKITLVKSPIGATKKTKLWIKNVGLSRTHTSRVVADNDAMRGLLNKVIQFVKVEGVNN